jgi:hypothetical protein
VNPVHAQTVALDTPPTDPALLQSQLDTHGQPDLRFLPAIPAAPQADHEWPCFYFHQHRRRWRSIHGVVLCGICVPPAHPGVVAEWLDPPTP